MATLITDPEVEHEILQQRRKSGGDRYDEVWEGVYIMAPMPNDNHQELVNALVTIFQSELGWSGDALVRPGVNVSDRTEHWEQNYRVPDVAVFLKNGTAVNHDSFWFGGPDFAVEITSPYDKTRDKIDFYSDVNTRELLIVDREPWQLELMRLEGEKLQSVGTATVENQAKLLSEVVPFSFELLAGEERPLIRVTKNDGGQSWEF